MGPGPENGWVVAVTEDKRWFVHSDGPDRIWFLFAMRDELPLDDDGWSVWRHEPRCGIETGGLRCQRDSGPCWAAWVRFIPFSFEDRGMEVAMADLATVAESLAAKLDPSPPFPMPGQPNRRWVAVVSMPTAPEDAVSRALDLIYDVLSALRLATGSSVPGFSIERVWPLYMIANSDGAGNVEFRNLVIVEHGRFGPLQPATSDQLELAKQLLLHRWRRSPIEIYLDFAQAARASLSQEGDYTKAVTSAAIACEILLKHAAWLVTFEALGKPTDPAAGVPTVGLGLLKPSQLIGQVLTKRLGGDWSSKDAAKPVGAWRHHVAQLRTKVLHRGHRPDVQEAAKAVEVMSLLEGHVCDRLAGRGAGYPRSAMALVGSSGLERRGALSAVKKALVGADCVIEWLSEYVATWTQTSRCSR